VGQYENDYPLLTVDHIIKF